MSQDEYEEAIERLCRQTERLTDVYRVQHEPVDGREGMRNFPLARLLAKLIENLDSGGPFYHLGFGGAGDDGEYLIGILDILIGLGIITVDLQRVQETIHRHGGFR